MNKSRLRHLLALSSLVVTATAGAAGAAHADTPVVTNPAATNIVTIPVSFSVVNNNTTNVACTADGATYTVRGHITAPLAAIQTPSSATLYLHAVTQGEFYWMFNGVPGYNFAQQMAGQNHVAVTIDRLGYGTSDRPPGLMSCFGSQATVAHEIIGELKTGTYKVAANPSISKAPAFPKMFLAGHSAGALVGTIESSTYHDVAGFVNFAWSDSTTSGFLTAQLMETEQRCAANTAGMPSANGKPGYEPFGNDPAGILFYSASAAVRAAVPAPAPDPCGDLISIPAAINADGATVSTDATPILLFQGANDALFPAPDMQAQATRYAADPDVTLTVLPATAHGYNYESSHDVSEQDVNVWLGQRGDNPAVAGTATPPPSLPDASAPVLFVLVGGMLGGLAYVARRRRQPTGTI